jgi:hypothetical protein
MLLAEIALKPSSFAVYFRSSGRLVPARAAQGHHIDPLQAFCKPCRIPPEHLPEGEQIVRQEHRLCLLHVGVAGHDGVNLPPGEGDEGFLQPGNEFQDIPDLVPQVETHVEGNLVVAAPAGMDFAACGTDPLDEAPLDGHVDVLVGLHEPEGARADFRPDFGQAL